MFGFELEFDESADMNMRVSSAKLALPKHDHQKGGGEGGRLKMLLYYPGLHITDNRGIRLATFWLEFRCKMAVCPNSSSYLVTTPRKLYFFT